MKKKLKSGMANGIRLLFLSAMLSGSLNVAGQISVAPNPVIAGTFGSSFSYSDTQNSQNYGNYYGRSTNDVAYKFTLTTGMDVVISNCGSSLSDTYMHLLDVNGSSIDSNDDYSGAGACSNTYNSVIKKTLPAGTYYVVSEGYSSNGSITTNITGTPVANNTTGNTFQNPIVMGTYGSSFNYSDSQNTANFTNTYGQSSNDVFYKFTLSIPLSVTISHCNSTLSDTYLHLLDAGGNRIAYNDDYSGTGACSNTNRSYLKTDLGAGTYYVVSEGSSSNGVIVTTVTGELQAAGIEYSYDASGNRTSRHLGAPSAVSNLRSSGVKYNKEGIISDPGRDASKDEVKQAGSAVDITVENPLALTVKIYPNPTDGLLTVNISGNQKNTMGEIRLYDFSGRNIYTRKTAGGTEVIDLSGYTDGTYMAVISIDGKTTVHKIIKNRK